MASANGGTAENFAATKYCPGAWPANKAGLTAVPFRSGSWPAK